MMPTSHARSWTVSCPACALVIGSVEGGRFVHDPACERPLAIGAGALRCCACGGSLTGTRHEFQSAPESPLAYAEPVLLRRDEARQRR